MNRVTILTSERVLHNEVLITNGDRIEYPNPLPSDFVVDDNREECDFRRRWDLILMDIRNRPSEEDRERWLSDERHWAGEAKQEECPSEITIQMNVAECLRDNYYKRLAKRKGQKK